MGSEKSARVVGGLLWDAATPIKTLPRIVATATTLIAMTWKQHADNQILVVGGGDFCFVSVSSPAKTILHTK